ncbi:hypothetical protein J4226_02865 [Candidatus Pacearchaeota archaeon]|nr:hypothetical protein [Candidatus Pacearchaeota archaeon]
MAEENKIIDAEVVKEEVKTEKVEVKKKKTNVKVRDVAMANGFGMRISPKQCKYICRVIRGKNPEAGIARLQAVIDEKRPIPMAGLEVAHRKGKGLAGARFPKNACKGVMEILKQAAANAVVAGIENPVVSIAKSDQAPAPFRRGGSKGKRAHIHIEIRDNVKMIEERKMKIAKRANKGAKK